MLKNVIKILPLGGSIGLLSYLLWVGKIGPLQFTFLFALILFLGFLLPVRDRLKELDIKNLRATLNEIKGVKEDIYAKAETVKKLAEEIAELTVFNVTTVGRFAGKDLTEKVYDAGQRVKSSLEQVGSDKPTIERITARIYDTVLFDLKSKISNRIQQITPQMLTGGKQIDRDKGYKDVHEILKSYNLTSSRETLIQYLKDNAVPIEELIPLIDRLEKFIKEKPL